MKKSKKNEKKIISRNDARDKKSFLERTHK